MKVIIAGSRTGFTLVDVERAIADSGFAIKEVVSGCARGVDTLGEVWARRNNRLVHRFYADWGMYGSRAGFVRNQRMGEYADVLIAVWDGLSPGTRHMIDIMNALEKPVHVLNRLKEKQQ